MTPKFMAANAANRLAVTAALLTSTFDWKYTVQGHDYWAQVYAGLLQLAVQAELQANGTRRICDIKVTDYIFPKLEAMPDGIVGFVNTKAAPVVVTHVLHGNQACCASKTMNPELLKPPVMWSKENEWVYRRDYKKSNCILCIQQVQKQIADKSYDGVS